jgi:sec-independent protein translocase protein TatA
MMSTQFLFISGGEIFFIMFIVVMVFGSDKIPGIAKGLGKGMRQLRDATEDIKQEIKKSADKQGIDTSVKNSIDTGIAKDVKKGFGDIGKRIGDAAGSVKRK